MKTKLLTLSLCISLLSLASCDTNENSGTTEKNKEIKAGKSGDSSLFLVKNETLKCGGGSYTNPINIDPNQPYINTYNVAYADNSPLLQNCPNNNRECIDLSHLVAIYSTIGFSQDVTPPPVFYSYSGTSQFNMYLQSDYSIETTEFSIGQSGDNAEIFGDFLPYNTFMTDDASNTVIQQFRKQYLQLSQTKSIKAIHIATDALLCIPSNKFIKMRIKYTNL